MPYAYDRRSPRTLIRLAMEHATPEALEKYLHEHPKADKSKHKVKTKGEAPKSEGEAKGDGKDESKPKDEPKKEEAKGEAKPEGPKKVTKGEIAKLRKKEDYEGVNRALARGGDASKVTPEHVKKVFYWKDADKLPPISKMRFNLNTSEGGKGSLHIQMGNEVHDLTFDPKDPAKPDMADFATYLTSKGAKHVKNDDLDDAREKQRVRIRDEEYRRYNPKD